MTEAFALVAPPMQRAHDYLVERGADWLKRNRCTVVLKEFCAAPESRNTIETPDVIGWRGTKGVSTLIECKTTRADFLKDKGKPWRIEPSLGMGEYRYYLCRPGLIRPQELAGWGLLYVYAQAVHVEVPSVHFDRNRQHETHLLLSALHRLALHHGAEFDALVHTRYRSNR